jgi:CubicO group peptidase (beta-lactamase class C family)
VADVLRDEIEADLERFKVPGVSWARIEGGEIVERGSAGIVDAGRPDPVTPRTLFQACSISKPVAVFAMLRLVDRGLLELDEDVNRRLTSWQIPPTGDWQPVVTLRQLASHSAGLTVHGFPGYRRQDELPTTVQILDGVRPTNTSPPSPSPSRTRTPVPTAHWYPQNWRAKSSPHRSPHRTGSAD